MIPARVLLNTLGIEYLDYHNCLPNIHVRMTEACNRILDMPFKSRPDAQVYVGHSGGKDSVLVRWLADNTLGTRVPTIHTPKPWGIKNAVHPLTKEFLYNLNRPIMYLPDGYLETNAYSHFKVQIDGTRQAEADRRDGRDVGLIIEGKEVSRTETPLYLKKGLFGKSYCYPIYDWSDVEVWTAIFAYDIPFSREYYIPSE